VALMRRRRRRRAWNDPLTRLLAVAAVASTGGVVGTEVLRVWRHAGDPGVPPEEMLAAAGEVTRQTVEVAREGYRGGSLRENALLLALLSFNVTWLGARVSATVIRRRGTFGPFRNAVIGRTHIHHFVPGIVLVLASGGASIVSRDERLDRWLAIPFGAGAALTLDESALLLRLDDVYWTEEGILSVQISLLTLSLMSAAALATRVLRRGERAVLLPGDEGGAPAAGSG
jgi:hypothetical protein